MTYRQKNLTQQQLREKFIQIRDGESWFSADYHIGDDENPTNKLDTDVDKDTDFDFGASNFAHIQVLFGPPPYEFLWPGDAPERFIKPSLHRERKMSRNRGESQYKGMRGQTINYGSLPKKPQFTTQQDERNSIHLWVAGVDMKMRDPFKLFETLKEIEIASDGGNILFNYRRPRQANVDHLAVGDTVTLWIMGEETDQHNHDHQRETFCSMRVDEMFKTPRAATATLYGRVFALAD